MSISPKLAELSAALRASLMQPNSPQGTKDTRKVILACLQPASALHARLSRCGTRHGKNNKRYDCKSPACPVCAERKSKAYFRDKLWPAMATTPKADIRWVTIVTHLNTDIDAGAAESRRLHTALKYVCSKVRGGRNLRVFGAREVEVYDAADFGQLSATKQALFTALGFPTMHVGAVYAFHWHLIIDLDGMPEKRLTDALRARWSLGNRQVHAEPLERRAAGAELRRLASYQTKVRMTKEPLDGDRRQWLSPPQIAQFAEGLHRQKPQWFRFSIV